MFRNSSGLLSSCRLSVLFIYVCVQSFAHFFESFICDRNSRDLWMSQRKTQRDVIQLLSTCTIRFWNLWCRRMFSTLQLGLVYISCFNIQIFCSDFQMCVYVCVFGCYFLETKSYCIALVSLLSWVTLTSTCGLLGTQASHVFVKNHMPRKRLL